MNEKEIINGYDIAQFVVERMEDWELWYEVLGIFFCDLLDRSNLSVKVMIAMLDDAFNEWDL